MKTEVIKRADGYYDLEVNGKLRVEAESFEVVTNVEFCLEHPEAVPTECGEVAQRILDTL